MNGLKSIVFLVLAMLCLIRGGMASEGRVLEGVINLNTATVEQLMLLPGVGEKRAATILEERAKKPFVKKDDLLQISGIGEKMVANWGSAIVFEGQTTLREKVVSQATPASVQASR